MSKFYQVLVIGYWLLVAGCWLLDCVGDFLSSGPLVFESQYTLLNSRLGDTKTSRTVDKYWHISILAHQHIVKIFPLPA